MAEYNPIEIARQYAPKFDKPVVDAVEVVRCKDCAYWQDDWETSSKSPNWHYCSMNVTNFFADEYCSRGERKEVEE